MADWFHDVRHDLSCAKVISDSEVFPASELGRQRIWSNAEKLRIVEESYGGQRQGSVVARHHGISRALLTQRRKAYNLGVLEAVRVAVFHRWRADPMGRRCPVLRFGQLRLESGLRSYCPMGDG